MQFMTALFGGPENTYLNAAFALGFVLVLILLGVWVLKLFARAGNNVVQRGRNRRLAVIDQVMVDQRRRLLIVRRDNVEHLILTGGPQDLLVESGIPAPEPQQLRRPAVRTAPATEAEIGRPAPAPHAPVSRDTVDQLRDLARPSPLKPVAPLRHTSALRPVTRQHPGLIPTAPELRVDNVGGASSDSAKSEPVNGTGGTRLGGGANRFFRSISRSDIA
ncbi:MAG TPA: flagellar biosynthetic protein FliO [Devosia sp.]|nr:flagellar biosynthetic protein FliO [Devosia sp.]